MVIICQFCVLVLLPPSPHFRFNMKEKCFGESHLSEKGIATKRDSHVLMKNNTMATKQTVLIMNPAINGLVMFPAGEEDLFVGRLMLCSDQHQRCEMK